MREGYDCTGRRVLQAAEQSVAGRRIIRRRWELQEALIQAPQTFLTATAVPAGVQVMPDVSGQRLLRSGGEQTAVDLFTFHGVSRSKYEPSPLSRRWRALLTRQRAVSSVTPNTSAISA